MMPDPLDAFFTAWTPRVEAALDALLPPAHADPSVIHEAMRYSVFAGGKRFRPILVLASADACGVDPATAMPLACAVEAVHTYSLIHDDLPSMDDSDTRRGKPTCHVKYGQAVAVLAGDALHDCAFEWITDLRASFPADRVLAVIREVAAAIGTGGMVGGQVLDLLAERRQLPADAVTEIHRRKTGALVRACARCGALLSGSEADARALGRYGEHLGLAFQITDDILDVVGEAEKMGKPPGGDSAAAKATYPAVFGLDRSRAMAVEQMHMAIDALAALGARAEVLRGLARFVVERDR
ncbi:MAG: polyprenyl synthetase family protein [Armatimonadota bacterium]|nr:polyprenyl synthetase family protein [Armatimonadota bacterium]